MRSLHAYARTSLVSSVSALAMLAGTPALAQTEQAEQEADVGIEEIVVTAQRQAESLQDVPIAVSAFSSEALQRQQIENTSDLQLSLPSSTYTKGNFTGANLTIRGIGSAVVAASGDAGIGIHFNDMPLINPRLFETEFYDMERLEVLRGPQGTLFGRNATGGVLNLITAKPKDEFQAAGEVQYGNFESIQAKGMVNVPLGDIGAVRLAGIYQNRDGFTKNLFTDNDIDGRDSYSIRGSIRLNPGDNTTLTVTAQYFDESSNRSRIQKQLCITDPTGILGCNPSQLGFGTINGDATLAAILTSREFLTIAGAGALAPFALGSVSGADGQLFSGSINPANVRQTNVDFDPVYRSDELIIHGELQHEFEQFTVTLNGGYSDSSVLSQTDYNHSVTASILNNPGLLTLRGAAAGGVPIAQLFLSQPLFSGNQICVSDADPLNAGFIAGRINRCADNTTEFDQSSNDAKQWSIEGRINTNFDGPLNFLLGGLYLKAHGSTQYFVNASGLDYAALLLGGGAGVRAAPFFNSDTDKLKLRTYGIFGEAYFEATDNLKFTAGLRYSNDRKFVRDRSALLTATVPFGTSDVDQLLLNTDADPSIPGVQPFREQTAKFDEITGRFVVDWKPELGFTDDTLIYASYSRGYKPGGINPPINPVEFEAPATFGSEKINAYEIGTKNVLGGGTAQINLTGFYYDYTGLQVSRIINRTSFNENTDATTYGVELETIFNPTRGLTINASLSYLKTEIKDLQLVSTRDPSGGRNDVLIIKDVTNASNCAVVPVSPGSVPLATTRAIVDGFNAVAFGGLLPGSVPVPGTSAAGAFSVCNALAGFLATNPGTTGLFELGATPLGVPRLPAGATVDLSGNELLNSPNWKFSVGAQYELELANGWTITPRADVHFTGEAFGTNFNDRVDHMPSYEIVNAQITVNSADERFYARAFVQNLFDVDAVTGMFVTDASSGLFTNIFTVDPRTYGIAAGFRF